MRRTLTITVVSMLILATPALATPGDVVSGYGVGGTHEIPHTGGPHWIGDIAARPTGEVIITGSSVGAGSGEQSFWVDEIAADGTTRSDLLAGVTLGAPYEFGASIWLKPDGSFYVAGDRGLVDEGPPPGPFGTDTDIFVAAFDTSGMLDTTFLDGSSPVPDGVVVHERAGTERATSVFTDGSSIVVGGSVVGAPHTGLALRFTPTGTLDTTFGSGGVAELAWTGFESFDRIETTVWPTGAGNYLAIGHLDAGKVSGMATMVVSDAGTGSVPVEFASGAVTHHDSTPLAEGTVAVAVQYFVHTGDQLQVFKLATDGTVAWETGLVPVPFGSGGVTLTELRNGSLAVASSTTDGDTEVLHIAADGTVLPPLVDAATYSGLIPETTAYASDVSALDGDLFVATVTNPDLGLGNSDELAVTRFEGDDSGRFVDDDGSTHEDNIERLAAEGITSGCDPDALALYCPADPVSRAQMATFLANAADIAPSSTDAFTDDDGNTHEDNINAIAAAGVTQGCDAANPGLYCPADPVTRGQMASFLVRAFLLETLGPPADPDPFSDDDGSVHEGNIAILFDLEITLGCDTGDPTRFCPDAPVTRAQMASFIMRTLDIVGPS